MEEHVPDVEVIVGTYEEFLVGYKLVRGSKDPSKVFNEFQFRILVLVVILVIHRVHALVLV